MAQSDSFSNGDVVRLRSGGPIMTVMDKVFGMDHYVCQWFVGEALHYGTFPAVSLEKTDETTGTS